MARKWGIACTDSLHLLQDNVIHHKAWFLQLAATDLNAEIHSHPPYFPDLASSVLPFSKSCMHTCTHKHLWLVLSIIFKNEQHPLPPCHTYWHRHITNYNNGLSNKRGQILTDDSEDSVLSKKSSFFCSTGVFPNPVYLPPWLGGRWLQTRSSTINV